MNILNKIPGHLRILRDDEMATINGGWHPFPHGIFGRDGKPFFGKDVVRFGVPAVVKLAAILIPGGAPFANAASAAAAAIVNNNTKH